MADQAELENWLQTLNDELDARRRLVDRLDSYHAGYPDTPEHVRAVKLEPEYRVLLRQAVTNWPELIVDSVEDRLEVTGFRFDGDDADQAAWELWQRAGLDGDAGLVHEAALVNGRAYAIVWSDGNDGVEITPEHASTTVVAYEVPSRSKRAAALRRWSDDGRWYATLYLPDGIYKFQARRKGTIIPKGDKWQRREVADEAWPLDNPLGVVPVVEFAVNRTLAPLRTSANSLAHLPATQDRRYGSAAGEFERVVPIIDRINTTIFNGLLAQAWSSFPVRALIGDPIKWQDKVDGNGDPVLDADDNPVREPVAPFQIAINRLIQIENPDGKLQQLPAADLANFIKFAESHIRHLAAITKTPAHYLLGELVNLSADAIRAAEAALVKKATKHQLTLGESWEEVMRLAILVQNPADTRAQAPTAETIWQDAESRSMAERADAAVKLKDIMPWQALAETILNASPQQINRWSTQRASDGLAGVLAAAAGEGNGPVPELAALNGQNGSSSGG